MPKQVTFEGMSDRALAGLIKRALREQEQRKEAAAEERKKQALRAVAKVAKDHGFPLAELLEEGTNSKKKKSHKKAPPKYQDPEDPSRTWSGKGRKPDWVKEHEVSGGNLTDLLIK